MILSVLPHLSRASELSVNADTMLETMETAHPTGAKQRQSNSSYRDSTNVVLVFASGYAEPATLV